MVGGIWWDGDGSAATVTDRGAGGGGQTER